MKIEYPGNYGNFAFRLTAEVEDGGNVYLYKQGLANLSYRVCGSAVDKELGVKDRKAVLYSSEDAERINAAVSAKIVALEAKENGESKKLKLSFAVIGEHEPGESAKPTKEATELWTTLQGWPEEKFAAACRKLGIGEEYEDADGIAACQKHLLEAKRAAAKAAKDALSV